MTITEAMKELKVVIGIEIADAMEKLMPRHKTIESKKNIRKTRQMRARKMVSICTEEKVGESAGEDNNIHSSSGLEKSLPMGRGHDRTFVEYAGVESIIRVLENFQPDDTLGDSGGDNSSNKAGSDS